MFYFFQKNKQQAGFTVIEFIVIMSIFAAMAAVALFNFRDFSDVSTLNNLTFDIALEIKRAQTIGSSSIDDFSGSRLPSAMSVFFRHDNNGIFEDQFEVYRERQSSTTNFGIIDTDDVLDRSSQIRGGRIVGIENCSNVCDAITDDIAVSFVRPRTEPVILSSDCDSGGPHTTSTLRQCTGELRITVASENREKVIHVEPSGNIYVE
jgi:type II secretory pathway pseudopilin PulG